MRMKGSQMLGAGLLLAMMSSATAATVTWDGGGSDGLWITGANWSGTPDNTVPANGDTINIGGANVITTGISALHGSNQLPNMATVNLTGNSTLSDGTDGVLRLNGSTLNVTAGSTLAGGFWDLNNGTLDFKDGAIATMGHWEQKGTNVINFELGSAGFTTLNPGTFRLGGGATIANATYNVDMSNYSGGVGVITLADFASDAASMDNTTFQGAGGLNVLNAGGYTANLQWNDTDESIELNVTGVPEPSSMILLCLAGLGISCRRRRS